MPDTITAADLKQIAARDTWSYDDYTELHQQLFATVDATGKFRELLADLEAANPSASGSDALKIGIGRYMLCRFEEALESFSNATDNKDRHFFAGQCYHALRHWDKAVEEFSRAKDRGWEGHEPDMMIVRSLAMAGQDDQARKAATKLISQIGKDSADAAFLEGLLAEMDHDIQTAIDHYVEARSRQERHPEASYRLAYCLDLYGEEEEAIDLYEECESAPPVYANALLNRAVLLEDNGEYEEAIDCLKKLLKGFPNHARARLFLRDAQASLNMYYDEDRARRIAKRNAVLDIPVTDFELSVRARNCLKKMNIHSLGDLVNTSEQDLLGYKNFGETSLKEIKDMLAAKGLRLGQALEDELPEGELDLLDELEPAHESAGVPISQLELSVRTRRVLEQLGVHTLGEIASHSEAELLAQKNFGQTSLNELRQHLMEHGMEFKS